MTDAWCLLGNSNTIHYKEDRIGGDEVNHQDIRKLSLFIEQCDLVEMRSTGSYFSWTNKSIWSRIDRSLFNSYWHDVFDFTQVKFDALGLLDHTPLIIQFPTSLKPQLSFKYCDMWSLHKYFMPMVTVTIPKTHHIINLKQVYAFLDKMRSWLRKLN